MGYRFGRLDLDHTLLDSAASEAAAFDRTVRSIGVTPTSDLFDRYRTINQTLWAAVERGDLTPDRLKLLRFEQFTESIGAEADPAVMAKTFTGGLGDNGDLYPGARAVLGRLDQVATLAMVTNGLSDVQRRRIERLDLARYFDAVVISAEVNTAKPGTAIFDLTFDKLGNPDRAEALMVGDSLTSDIQGGHNAGVDTCLYDPAGVHPPDARPTPTHRITTLEELVPLVAG
ncbi:MAG: YjjG family noncanonical pyrimidine nucleotidase [Actinomycetota bacterium]